MVIWYNSNLLCFVKDFKITMLSSIERYAGIYLITGMGWVCLNDHGRKQNTTVKMVDECMSVDVFSLFL